MLLKEIPEFTNDQKNTFKFLYKLSNLTNEQHALAYFKQSCTKYYSYLLPDDKTITDIYKNACQLIKLLLHKPIDINKVQKAVDKLDIEREFKWLDNYIRLNKYFILPGIAYIIKGFFEKKRIVVNDLSLDSHQPNQLSMLLCDFGIISEDKAKPIFKQNPSDTTLSEIKSMLDNRFLNTPTNVVGQRSNVSKFLDDLINNCLKKLNITNWYASSYYERNYAIFVRIAQLNDPVTYSAFFEVVANSYRKVYRSFEIEIQDWWLGILQRYYSNGNTIDKNNATLEAFCTAWAGTYSKN